ncbi:MAG: phosphoglucosamine mutase [Verrucomicrobia bacterium]|nr:phosphoglucosamine mutase [Verrucomicrobiota bacterium]
MGKLFGTDGIRGVANTWPMTAETALAVGRATAHICRQHEGRHRIVIGKDTRLSGYMLENALTAGICSMGVDVLLVGPLPTPGIAFITESMRADAGIVISASHNPFQDNGIKIFARGGIKLSDAMEAEIEALVSSGRINDIRPTADHVGKAFRIEDALGRYIVFCKNAFPRDLSLDGLHLVLDCANGATYKVAPIVFSELGARVTTLHHTPDGTNINRRCGSQHPEELARKVVEVGAHAGLAFDGDGDRMIAVDEKGQALTGDHVLAICAQDMQARGILAGNQLVCTPMSNIGLRMALKGLGIGYCEANVGDRNVLVKMRDVGANLGGEQSGHILFLDHHSTGDGIISCLQVLAIMQQTQTPLSRLADVMQIAPQALINVPVAEKPPIDSIAGLQAAIRKGADELADAGRVFVRYSGTEPICRVMVEGPTIAMTERIANTLADLVRARIGTAP